MYTNSLPKNVRVVLYFIEKIFVLYPQLRWLTRPDCQRFTREPPPGEQQLPWAKEVRDMDAGPSHSRQMRSASLLVEMFFSSSSRVTG